MPIFCFQEPDTKEQTPAVGKESKLDTPGDVDLHIASSDDTIDPIESG